MKQFCTKISGIPCALYLFEKTTWFCTSKIHEIWLLLHPVWQAIYLLLLVLQNMQQITFVYVPYKWWLFNLGWGLVTWPVGAVLHSKRGNFHISLSFLIKTTSLDNTLKAMKNAYWTILNTQQTNKNCSFCDDFASWVTLWRSIFEIPPSIRIQFARGNFSQNAIKNAHRTIPRA